MLKVPNYRRTKIPKAKNVDLQKYFIFLVLKILILISRLQHGRKLGDAQSLGHGRDSRCPPSSESGLGAEADLPDHPHHLLLSSRLELDPTHPRVVHAKEALAIAVAHSGGKLFLNILHLN